MLKKPLLTMLSTAAISAVAALSVPATSLLAAPSEDSPGQAKKLSNNLYIVRLSELPVVAYEGTIDGYQATKPKQGQKIDPDSPQVVKYKSYLDARHDAVLAAAGGGRKVYDYGYAFNGFAAELSAAQVETLRNMRGVVTVEKDEAQQLDTATTPAFLGLSGPDGVWATTGARGENVIIGIVDGGVWPEHPSFSDRTGTNGNDTQDGKLDYQQIPGWHGKCVPGQDFNASNCSQKLIGARWYNAGWGGDAGIRAQLPWEFVSPRDFGGHGTHTASTSGGNSDVQATGLASAFGKVSGIAPRARIAAYKVCWQTPDGGSCFSTDSVAAIDQAVADGVDVINFSISGSRTSFLDSVEVAFLYAANAGVFVAASAGNSGPTTSTVAHPGPWLTTVAAGTHNRNGEGSATLGNDVTVTGASYANAVGPKPLILASAAALPGADPTRVKLCFDTADNGGTPVLDPAIVAGKIVVCERGTNVLVNKSQAVYDAGGAGVLLVNTPTSANTQLAILHVVPLVHIAAANYAAVTSYAATPGATATINQSHIVLNATAPLTASFSSRGPLLAGNGDLLKPDLIAPGQDVLAGVAPPGNNGKLFDLYSGTSMSSPHVAGLAALFKEMHPDWSPMMIKSALMTTGYDVLDGGTPAPNTNPVLIFRQGAGHVDPPKAIDPGLVYNSGWNDWLAFLCGTTSAITAGTCNTLRSMGYSTDPSDINIASIAIGDLAGAQTITRRVTNVGASSATYTASVTGMSGFSVAVSPASLTLAKGQTKSFTITFTRTTAALNGYTGGQLRWTDGTHVVRSPILARPVALAAPVQTSGSYNVTFGYAGSFSATARGLIPADITGGSVTQDPDQTFSPADPAGTIALPVTIAAGTTYARFSLFDADVTAGSDIDLYVYNSAGTLVASSGNGGSNEEANLVSPAAGNYTVYIHGWGLPAGVSPFKLHTWLLGTADAGNMTVTAPTSATIGGTGTIALSFGSLTPGVKYLGSVAYAGVAGLPNPTIVRVDP